MFMGVSDDGDNMCDLFQSEIGVEWESNSDKE